MSRWQVVLGLSSKEGTITIDTDKPTVCSRCLNPYLRPEGSLRTYAIAAGRVIVDIVGYFDEEQHLTSSFQISRAIAPISL